MKCAKKASKYSQKYVELSGIKSDKRNRQTKQIILTQTTFVIIKAVDLTVVAWHIKVQQRQTLQRYLLDGISNVAPVVSTATRTFFYRLQTSTHTHQADATGARKNNPAISHRASKRWQIFHKVVQQHD